MARCHDGRVAVFSGDEREGSSGLKGSGGWLCGCDINGLKRGGCVVVISTVMMMAMTILRLTYVDSRIIYHHPPVLKSG